MFVYAKQTILFKHRINGWIPNWENVIIFLDLQSNEPGSAFTLQICTLQANKHNFFSFQIYVRNAPNEQWACNWFEVSTWRWYCIRDARFGSHERACRFYEETKMWIHVWLLLLLSWQAHRWKFEQFYLFVPMQFNATDQTESFVQNCIAFKCIKLQKSHFFNTTIQLFP